MEDISNDIQEFSNVVKIPKDRIAVVIGTKGENKARLQKETGVKIDVDSAEGDVTLSGKDSLKIFILGEYIKAVGRGFNPAIAEKLLSQDYVLEIINLTDYVKNKNHFARLKGRLIGTKGKSRAAIERLTETDICVYGKTVGIIGKTDAVPVARRACDSLLAGSPHSSVYKWLEKARIEMKKREHSW